MEPHHKLKGIMMIVCDDVNPCEEHDRTFVLLWLKNYIVLELLNNGNVMEAQRSP
jgi:hypothetical protein